jgi:hypothetical protein
MPERVLSAFINGFNDYAYDRFQNLDLRFILGGGVATSRGKENADASTYSAVARHVF